jgi:hypothetical protein
MKKEDVDLTEFVEIKIIVTGYTRPGAQNAETYTSCYSNSPPLSSQQEVHFVLGKKGTLRSEQSVNALQA